ncbi:class I SAM-dependent methyltransferase, partial [Helicobacter pullorum]
MKIETIFKNEEIKFNGNFMEIVDRAKEENQSQTAEVFSEKWVSYSKNVSKEEQEKLWQFQKEWYLKLYGFDDERDLASFLKTKKVVFDAGCGLGYLSEWFARLSPQSTIVAMDISQSVEEAAKKYKDIPNIFFIRGDIAKTPFKDEVMDYISCHAVIMHTENPEKTFCEFNRILKRNNNSIEA